MSTEKLYYVNQYQAEATATIKTCVPVQHGWEVTLDRTVFYPTGGGQPCDLGTLGGTQVLDVSLREDEVIHLCNAPLPVGQSVPGRIDWARRFSLMQQHSGEHLVSGIVHRRFGYDNVGFHMGSEAVTIDFSGELSAEALREVELEVNRTIWSDIPSEIFYPDAEELSTLPYRSKKALSGAVRLVHFPGVDLCACCGLHVARSGEIGLVKFLSAARFHGGSRIELLCGERALLWLNAVTEQNRAISALLSAKPMQTAAAVQRQSEELASLQVQAAQLERRLFAAKAEALREQGDLLLLEPPMPAVSVRRLANAVLQTCSGRCAVFAGEGQSYQYAIGAPGGDLRAFCKELNAALRGRGGGKADFVQGSVAATAEEISAFFGK